ncbi:hypothetical protein EG834_09210 [bacterium]|nr:hypothetical protein [bacterium]
MKYLIHIAVFLSFQSVAMAVDFKSLETVYNPSEKGNIKSYYLNGIPFAAISNDSSFVLLFLEAGKIASYHYAKVWVLYQNLSAEPYLLEPLNQMKLTIEIKGKTYAGMPPVPPSQIMKSIDNEKNVSMILQAVGGALKAVSADTRPEATVTSPSGAVYEINNRNEGDRIIENTKSKMNSTADFYYVFQNSVNNGILRKNTIFQDKGVTGNVYFLVSGIDLQKCSLITLYITTKDGINVVSFTPAKGE